MLECATCSTFFALYDNKNVWILTVNLLLYCQILHFSINVSLECCGFLRGTADWGGGLWCSGKTKLSLSQPGRCSPLIFHSKSSFDSWWRDGSATILNSPLFLFILLFVCWCHVSCFSHLLLLWVFELVDRGALVLKLICLMSGERWDILHSGNVGWCRGRSKVISIISTK